ncbi:MAG: F0F1 ATP synthase subunit delta [Prevotellaceae bacterium]|nr:F0F1 ATP synthase subunit delta [Prevotellaceae bacterium]
MTIGILSTRYAKALYSFALERGEENEVYREMKMLAHQLIQVPELQRAIDKPILTGEQKEQLLETAAGGEISNSSKRFFRLVLQKEENENLRYMAAAYQTVYRKAKNIIYSRYISACEVDDEILKKIKKLISKNYEESVTIELESQVNPELIGGFVLQIDDKKADASVSGELKRMRKNFR